MAPMAGVATMVRCPFYRKDTAQTVTCEGLVENSTIRLQFGRVIDAGTQKRVFCCARYQNCEIYRAVMEAKYGGVDRGE